MKEIKTTYYEILGIEKSATKQEIKQAYRKLVVLCHPDRIGNTEENRERFFNIQKAYDTLFDDELRRAYDLRLEGNTPTETGATSTRTYNDVINALATFEAQIIANEGKKMTESDRLTVHAAIGMAREMYYESGLGALGHHTDIAARLIKKIIETRKEVNRNEATADYLDQFADSILGKCDPPEFVSTKQKRTQKLTRIGFVVIAIIIVLVGGRKLYKSLTEEYAEAPREKVQIDSTQETPYEAPESAPVQTNEENKESSKEPGASDINRDSLDLKDSGIYDF